ncbi:hypothetical protein ABN034_14080 [Actinopolymorpha sp. B11F2]|uniref:hypothetical protein n=1 Tax=Actinopolymorpha sp. B11F2 TaxID=3160862 RepID=UPI0032E4A9D6
MSTAANNETELRLMPQSLSNKRTAVILLGIALLLMPVAAIVGGATRWVVIAGSVVMLFLCAYNINVKQPAH